MATFRDSEKQRYQALKGHLFSAGACRPGAYNRRPREFCLADECAAENLHESLRDDAITYFRDRAIHWHDGTTGGLPSNHLCCSQSACVNVLWPLTRAPTLLAHVFRPFLPDLAEPLPFVADLPLPDGTTPFLAFEWIGTRNYLGETRWGTRGAHATSADFAFRFRNADNNIQLVLGEWKYTEDYRSAKPKAARTLEAQKKNYTATFGRWKMDNPALPDYATFFVEPFYQLMRLTLLACEMEAAQRRGDGEMGADTVTVVHIAPRANREFALSISAPALRTYGDTVSAIWTALAPERFVSIATESLLEQIDRVASGPLRPWADYLLRRYSWWRPTAGGAHDA